MKLAHITYASLLTSLVLLNGGCAAKFRAISNAGNVAGANGSGNGNGEARKEDSDALSSIQRTFTNPTEGSNEFKVSISNGFFTGEFKLTNGFDDKELNLAQNDRPMRSKMFKQGSSGNPITDNFTQSAQAGVVDILIVMDNSGSMADEQASLSTRLNPLLQYISGANWRIGVITTDPSNACMRAIINKGDANAATIYSNAMKAGSGGSGNERGIEQAIKGLSCPNNNWVRPGSSLAVLIVSDEDNCSTGIGKPNSTCPSNYAYGPAALTGFISGTMNRKLGIDARVYGIIYQPNTSCPGGYNVSNEYSQLVSSTAGKSGSICAADFSPVLSTISNDIATILKNQFQLSETPDAGSVSVTVNNQPWTGFSVTGNVITFSNVPPNGAAIKVSYSKGAQPQLRIFSLEERPAAGTVSVTLNNMTVASSQYVVNYSTNAIEFNAAPVASSDIKVDYRLEAPALKTAFAIGTGVVANTLKVYVNGTMVNNYTYNATSGNIEFASAPADASLIKATFTHDEGPMLSYAFQPLGANVRNLSGADKASGQPVRVSYSNGQMVVDAADFVKDRVVMVKYRTDESNKSDITLPAAPIDGSVLVQKAPTGCDLGSGLEIMGNVLHIDCEIPDNSEFVVQFKYLMPPQKEYVLSGVTNPEAGQWLVKVNNVLNSTYRREGNKIIFDEDLPLGATVFVSFTFERI